ncbi:MAG: 50S ribosomal protein L6 [Patescibacteria group bacterium]
MSKIGQQTITVPTTVQLEIGGSDVKVKSTNGELSFRLPKAITVSQEGNIVSVKRSSDSKSSKSLHGLYRSLISNAVNGLDKAWTKNLEVVGTGFNVKMQGEDLLFKVGYSHTVTYKKVEGIKFTVDGTTKVSISGADKQLVGQVAYQIKMIRKPDVYKGKGIRYEGEHIKLKAGKKAKTA